MPKINLSLSLSRSDHREKIYINVNVCGKKGNKQNRIKYLWAQAMILILVGTRDGGEEFVVFGEEIIKSDFSLSPWSSLACAQTQTRRCYYDYLFVIIIIIQTSVRSSIRKRDMQMSDGLEGTRTESRWQGAVNYFYYRQFSCFISSSEYWVKSMWWSEGICRELRAISPSSLSHSLNVMHHMGYFLWPLSLTEHLCASFFASSEIDKNKFFKMSHPL